MEIYVFLEYNVIIKTAVTKTRQTKKKGCFEMEELKPRGGKISGIINNAKEKFSFEKALNVSLNVSKWCKNIARVLDEMIIPELKRHITDDNN